MKVFDKVIGLIKLKQLPITSIICPTGLGFGDILYSLLSRAIHPRSSTEEMERLTQLFNEKIKAVYFVDNQVLKKQYLEKSKKHLEHHDAIDCVVLKTKKLEDYFLSDVDLFIFDESFLLQNKKQIRYIAHQARKYGKMVIFLSRMPNMALTYESFIVLENNFGSWRITKDIPANISL